MKLHHPIVNLCTGKRLYYFLLSAPTGAAPGENAVIEILRSRNNRTASFEDRSGFYVVFGEADFVLRVWSTEQEAYQLYDEFHRSRVLEIDGCFLCSRTSIWFQREIEKNSEWSDSLSCDDLDRVSESVQQLHDGKIPNELIWDHEETCPEFDTDGRIKMFTFVKEENPSKKLIYNLVNEKLVTKAQELEHLKRISLYSTYDVVGDGRFLLMKAEASSFSEGTRALRALGEWLGEYGDFSTTTHVVCETRWQAEVGTYPNKKMGPLYAEHVADLTLIDDLCRVSHEQYERNVDDKLYRNRRLFCQIFGTRTRFSELFWYSEHWARDLNRLRQVGSLVANERNDDLKALIIADYIFMEKTLRDAAVALYMSIDSSNKKGVDTMLDKAYRTSSVSELSLKGLLGVSGKMLKGCENSAEFNNAQKNIISTMNDLGEVWVTDRNLLAHGDIVRLFIRASDLISANLDNDKIRTRFKDEQFSMVWEFLVSSYFRVRVYLPRYLKILMSIATTSRDEI